MPQGLPQREVINTNRLKLKAAAPTSLALKQLEHPNKMPFEGVFTYFDVPSDAPPGGATGKRVVIPSEWGVPALKTLQGMAVNFDSLWMKNHASKNKIGIIEDAWTGERDAKGGTPVYVRGYIYAHDFPEEALQIKAEQGSLGFSYETVDTPVRGAVLASGEAVWMVCGEFAFSGGAILLADKAAYTKTSLAASAESAGQEEEGLELQQVIEQVMAAIEEKYALTVKAATVVEAEIEVETEEEDKKDGESEEAEKTEEGAEGMRGEEAAESEEDVKEMKAAEDGADAESGVELKAAEVGAIEVKAAADALGAQVLELQAEVESLKTQLKAESDAKAQYQHKGFAYPTTLAARFSLDASADSYETQIATVDARTDLSSEDKLALKFELRDRHVRALKESK